MWSDRADEAYKRLSRTISVPAGGTTLSFWTSYNLELDFDYMIVEAHTVGQDNWTTLPDENGHTTRRPEHRPVLHGRLEQSRRRGQRAAPVPAALPDVRSTDGHLHQHRHHAASGTPRTAAPAAGSSSRSIIPAAWARRSRSRSPRAQRLGLPAVPGRVHRRHRRRRPAEGNTSFEEDANRWTAGPSPARRRTTRGIEGPNRNDWVRRGGLGIKEGAAVATDRHALPGLRPRGHHGCRDVARRGRWVASIDYLLR